MAERDRAAVDVQLLGRDRLVAQAPRAPAARTLRSARRDRNPPASGRSAEAACASRAPARCPSSADRRRPMPSRRCAPAASGRSVAARVARVSTTAAPPSVMPDDVPAVMMPGCPSTLGKTGGELPQRLDASCPRRGCSSVVDRPSSGPSASVTVTGAISSRKRPAAIAAAARRWVSSA